MTEKRTNSATKHVDFTEKQAEEQIATGVALVPDKVDWQGDFVREDTIRQFAEQFENFVDVGEADGGILHAVWPSEWMELEESRVLDEAETIGGEEVPAGSWIQSWRINDGDLWELVESDVLGSLSIGARDVRWDGPWEQDEAPEDVEIPDEFPDDELVYELADGLMRETSTVDIPAVPDAHILDTKGADEFAKALQDHVGNREGFISDAMERGHDEADAERLWELISRAMEVDGAGEPGQKGFFHRVGKAAFQAAFGTDDDGTDTKTSEDPTDPAAAKEGRTLSRQNRESLFATIDASLDVLEDAGVDHGMGRFTDSDEWAFDLSEHSARTWENPEEEEPDEEPDEETENAAGSDTPDDTTMSDNDNEPDNGNDGEGKSLAEQNAEQIEQLTQSIDDLAEAVEDDGEEKTVELEIGGDVYEVSESEAKAWFEDGEEPEADPMDEAPEYIRALESRVEEANQRIERINEQSGFSDQIDAAGTGGNGDGGGEKDAMDALTEALS